VNWTTAAQRLDGRLAFGGWHHTGDFERFDGAPAEKGTSGPYARFDQMIWRFAPDDPEVERNLAGFLMYGYADPAVSLAAHHAGGGLVWTGLFSERGNDSAGLGFSYLRLSDSAVGLSHRDEIVIETFYKIRVLKWASLKPDLQYVIHPVNATSDHALAFVLQAVFDL